MENGQKVLNKFKIHPEEVGTKFKVFNFILLLFTIHYSLFTVVNADVIDEIKAKQKNIKTVKANFYQEKHTEILEKPIISKGIFYYSSPYNVRWEYTQNTPASLSLPRSKAGEAGRAEHSDLIVIYDGKTVYLYYPDMKEADKIDSPLQFPSFMNFDISSLKNNYDISYRADKSGSYTIVLKPKVHLIRKPEFSNGVSSIEMLFAGDKVFPEEVKITEKGGDKTLIKFSDVEINKILSEDLFKFIPETGIKIRERSLR